ARAITPHADKLLRIESLQPHMANGLIRLHPSQTVLEQQLRHFPAADHDDGPDALHMLWMLATTGFAPIEATLVKRRHEYAPGLDDSFDTGGRFGGAW
ncbi:phage terminase large subunit, partial [Pseudomonas aeruginosa]|nr:phage terminase large subunit [Pseudomonas aeruginosa]